MALRVALLLLLSFSMCVSAAAQESVRRMIFEDCEQAKAEYSILTVEQQTSLLDYLTRIISLNTESPSAPEAFAVQPGSQVSPDSKALPAAHTGDLLPGTLWQSADGKRELRAKRCALEILEGAGAMAFSTLPSLVTTYSEQPLSDEIGVGLEEVTALIAELAHKGGTSPSIDDIKLFASHALGSRPLIARNLIHEFRNESLALLVAFIADGNRKLSDDDRAWLGSLDPDGSLVMRAALEHVHSLTKEQAAGLMKEIPPTRHDAEALFIKDFISLANNEELSAVFTPILGQACERLKGLTIDPNLQTAVSSILGILNPDTLPDSSVICLSQSSLPLAKQVKQILISNDPIQRTHAIDLLAKGLRATSNELNSEFFAILRNLALETDSAYWTSAIKALASFKEHGDELVTLALQLLKQASKIKDTERASLLSNSAFALLKSAKLSNESINRVMPSIVASVRSSNPNPTAIQIAKNAPNIDQTLAKLALTSPPRPSSLKALEILSARSDVPDKGLLPLVDLLRFPDSQLFAERSLLHLGKPTVSALRRHLPRFSSGDQKNGAIGILVVLDVATNADVRELANSLGNAGDCSFIKQREGLLCALYRFQENDPEVKALISPITNRCLPELDHMQLFHVSSCDPDSVLAASESLGKALAEGKISDAQMIPIVNLAIRELRGDSRESKGEISRSAELIRQILLYGKQEAKENLLMALSEPQRLDPTVQDALRTLAGTPIQDSSISRAALLALAASGDTVFPWRDFVKASLALAKSGSLDSQIAEILSMIPENEVLEEVVPALEGNQSEDMIAASLVGAALGSKAVPIVSRLWHLRERRSPSVRYTASLALLQINPLTPDMHDSLKRVLVNRYFKTAQSMGILWDNTVAVNDLDRGTFGTLRLDRLKQLLHLGPK
jgi:hypothetical protein